MQYTNLKQLIEEEEQGDEQKLYNVMAVVLEATPIEKSSKNTKSNCLLRLTDSTLEGEEQKFGVKLWLFAFSRDYLPSDFTTGDVIRVIGVQKSEFQGEFELNLNVSQKTEWCHFGIHKSVAVRLPDSGVLYQEKVLNKRGLKDVPLDEELLNELRAFSLEFLSTYDLVENQRHEVRVDCC